MSMSVMRSRQPDHAMRRPTAATTSVKSPKRAESGEPIRSIRESGITAGAVRRKGDGSDGTGGGEGGGESGELIGSAMGAADTNVYRAAGNS